VEEQFKDGSPADEEGAALGRILVVTFLEGAA
jgi:hypothetical protein